MRVAWLMSAALTMTGCTIQRIGSPGVTLTRPVRVKPSDVVIYASAAMVSGHFTIVDDLSIEDDGAELPRVLEKRLRGLAGARGANAIILDPLNRKPNGTRIVTSLTLDDPFKHFRATAIYVGDGPPPVQHLGTLGRNGQ